MELKIKKLVPEAELPQKAHESDAGYDLVAVSAIWDEEESCHVCGTGLSMEIPEGFVGLIFPRSSIAKKDIFLTNCVGVIDSGYRGEVKAKFKRLGGPWLPGENPIYKEGDRFAQIIFMPLPEVDIVEVQDLEESDRGEGGFGSSGE